MKIGRLTWLTISVYPLMKLEKIISGGQTGADQGALDGARARKFPYGGAIPAGRKTEAGPLPASYDMEELQTEYYPVRTRKNVEDGDGTLIVSHGHLTGGSYLTLKIAQELRKPWIHIDFNLESDVSAQVKIVEWLESNADLGIARWSLRTPTRTRSP